MTVPSAPERLSERGPHRDAVAAVIAARSMPADRGGGMARARRQGSVTRRAIRIASEAHVQLAVGLAIPSILATLIGRPAAVPAVIGASLALVTLQALIATRRRHPAAGSGLPVARLAMALAFVASANWLAGGSQPLVALNLPIVAFAAALGVKEGLIVAVMAGVAYLLPLAFGDAAANAFLVQRVIAHASVLALLALGTRRTVDALERTIRRARRAGASERRRTSQIAAVADVGRALAAGGLTADAMSAVATMLADRFEYPYVSIYLREGDRMRMGAQLGYDDPILVFPADRGIIGQVMRTGRPVLLADVRADPAYVSANPNVCSEVCVPMVVDGELLGVLNVERGPDQPLDDTDLSTMLLVADRLASALALSRERGRLAERAEAFRRLTEFSAVVADPADPDAVVQRIVDAVGAVVRADIVVMTLRSDPTGDFRIAAVNGADSRLVGRRIESGDGVTGTAIATRHIVRADRVPRTAYPDAARGTDVPAELAIAAVPIIVDAAVLGVLLVSRLDLDHPFDDLDGEVLELLAGQVGFAVTNARLHRELEDASLKDSLTGLGNRRQLDATLARMMAARSREVPAERRPVSAILFDLDHFGQVNKAHGHAAGDEVLRAFARILGGRFRASDVVVRFGGEEFVAILDGATRDQAAEVAIRVGDLLRTTAVAVAGTAEAIRVTVSAGVAQLSEDGIAIEPLLELCDLGLRQAKRQGRDRVVAA